MPRDNFASKRKALALEVLSHFPVCCESPNILDLCMLCLKSKKKDLILGALGFIDMNLQGLNDFFTSDFIDLLDGITLKTKSRSVVFKVLDVQIKNGNISEAKALKRMDDWKSKNIIW